MQDITVYQGKRVTVPATVTDADGAVIDLTDKTLTFQAVDTWSGAADVTVNITPTITNAVSGLVAIPFQASDTASLTVDGGLLRLKFRLGVQEAGESVVVATGILHVIDAD